MSSTRVLAVGAAAAVLALANLSGPAGSEAPPRGAAAPAWAHGGPAGGAAADAVLAWNAVAVNTLTGLPGPAGGAPPAAQVHVAMVQGAVYDAVNATTPKHHRPYLLERRLSARASTDAAVATAAHHVLRHIVSTVPNLSPTAQASLLADLDARYAASLGAVPDGPFERQGVAAGEAAAAAMVAARTGDGRFGPSQWVPSTAVGHWWPSTGPTGQLVLDPTPWVGAVRPFLMTSSSQFRTPGPVALTSATWAHEYNEVKALGAVDSTVRTEAQTYIARWWQSTPVLSWNQVARELAARSGLDAAATTRLLAMENLSAADAAINCWNDKYHFDFWRPGNAIARAAEDGNPATAPQAGWAPLIAAPYPEHPSGHLCLDGAHTRVLQEFFGDTVAGGYAITSASTLLATADPRTRTFGSFSQALAELVEARIWAGLHFRTADVQARTLGEDVADYAAAHYFQRVGSWRRAPHRGHRDKTPTAARTR